ncbi:hypothetical protein L9F63_028270, partial [Diploptera punctata]
LLFVLKMAILVLNMFKLSSLHLVHPSIVIVPEGRRQWILETTVMAAQVATVQQAQEDAGGGVRDFLAQ